MFIRYTNTLATVYNKTTNSNIIGPTVSRTTHNMQQTRHMGWRAGVFPNNSEYSDKKKHLSVIHDSAHRIGCQLNTMTHTSFKEPFKKGILDSLPVSDIDLKGNNQQQHIAIKDVYLTPAAANSLQVQTQYASLLVSGTPIAERLNHIFGYASDLTAKLDTPLDDGF